MRLYLDNNLLIQEFKNKLYNEIDNSRERLEADIKSKMGSSSTLMTLGLAQSSGELKTSLEFVRNKIRLYVDGNAITLFNNYGSGSLMDVEGNALIDEYINGDNWNPYRSKSDTRIKGRPEGIYTDIFGRTRYSTGLFAGKNLEGVEIYNEDTGGYVMIEPQAPSHAIEYGLAWYIVELPELIENAIYKMDFSKCFSYK